MYNKPKKLSKIDTKIPNWNRKNLFHRKCPICSVKGKIKYIRPDGLEIHKCDICGIFYVSPIPEEKDLKDFYAIYTDHHKVNLNEKYKILVTSVNPFYDLKIREIVTIIDPKNKDVLDVGCGYGQNLINFKKLGANITGIDLNHRAVEYIKKELKIVDVYCCGIDEFDPSKKYDIICMNDFIEHPLNPLEILKKAKNLLKEDGILVIWTPNSSNVNDKLEPELFRLDLEHMQYFSIKTFNYLALNLDLQIVHCESLGFPDFNQNNFFKSILNKFILFLRVYMGIDIKHISNDDRIGDYNLFIILKKFKS